FWQSMAAPRTGGTRTAKSSERRKAFCSAATAIVLYLLINLQQKNRSNRGCGKCGRGAKAMSVRCFQLLLVKDNPQEKSAKPRASCDFLHFPHAPSKGNCGKLGK